MVIPLYWVVGITSGDPLIDFLVQNGSAITILAYVIVALQRGWLVTGRENERVVSDLERAMELIYKQAEATGRALDVAEKR